MSEVIVLEPSMGFAEILDIKATKDFLQSNKLIKESLQRLVEYHGTKILSAKVFVSHDFKSRSTRWFPGILPLFANNGSNFVYDHLGVSLINQDEILEALNIMFRTSFREETTEPDSSFKDYETSYVGNFSQGFTIEAAIYAREVVLYLYPVNYPEKVLAEHKIVVKSVLSEEDVLQEIDKFNNEIRLFSERLNSLVDTSIGAAKHGA